MLKLFKKVKTMSKNKILSNIKKNINNKVELKEFNVKTTKFKDKKAEFIKNLQNAGGEIIYSIEGFDVVLEGVFGVAENGAILLKEELDRKKYTYYESIAIILNPNSIVDTMHQAYKRLKINNFALFMSGPSKTADIEQSLVIGAHGAKRLGVYFEQ